MAAFTDEDGELDGQLHLEAPCQSIKITRELRLSTLLLPLAEHRSEVATTAVVFVYGQEPLSCEEERCTEACKSLHVPLNDQVDGQGERAQEDEEANCDDGAEACCAHLIAPGSR